MPQMSPMNWNIIPIFSIIMFLMFSKTQFKSSKKLSNKTNLNFMNMKKW